MSQRTFSPHRLTPPPALAPRPPASQAVPKGWGGGAWHRLQRLHPSCLFQFQAVLSLTPPRLFSWPVPLVLGSNRKAPSH